MIAQCSELVIVLIFCVSLLVFSGEEGGQDKGEEEGGGRGDDGSSCRQRPKTRRSWKKGKGIDRLIFCACSPANLLSFAFSAEEEEDQEGGG